VFLDLVYKVKIGDPQKDEAEKGENISLFACCSPDLC
jgi:hypothetical protein